MSSNQPRGILKTYLSQQLFCGTWNIVNQKHSIGAAFLMLSWNRSFLFCSSCAVRWSWSGLTPKWSCHWYLNFQVEWHPTSPKHNTTSYTNVTRPPTLVIGGGACVEQLLQTIYPNQYPYTTIAKFNKTMVFQNRKVQKKIIYFVSMT